MTAFAFFVRVKPFIKILIALIVALPLDGCRSKRHVVSAAFYYWKTTYAATAESRKAMQALGADRVYLRCFDVDWNEAAGRPQPVAVVRLPARMDSSLSYVPVVFITQKAITTLKPAGVQQLADNSAKLIADLCASSGITPKEIQIDCDWSAASRDVYFSLLRCLRNEAFFKQKILSCTIRLHQIKYRLRSGIPPSDRGMLMLYNIGSLKDAGAKNSILDVRQAKDYLAHLDGYPLPLDVVLPVFSWCLLFRDGVFAGIIRDAAPSELTPPLFTNDRSDLYTVQKDTFWHDYGLRAGDVIRAESAPAADLEALAAYSARRLKSGPATIAFFGADSIALSHYSTDELKKILDAYH